jgi:Polyketide cyclase / dehydrase and lipid transport
MDEIAWQLEHAVECDATADFAWSFMTRVANWDDPPARFVLDGPFVAGSRGTTHMPGQPPVHWRIQDVRPGRLYILATELDRATLSFEWRFDRAPGRGTVLTQRIMLSGENATAYMDSIAASFGANLPAGMRRIAAAIAEAEARVGGPG